MGFKDKVRNKQNSEHKTVEEYHKSIHEKYLASRNQIVSTPVEVIDVQEDTSIESIAEDSPVTIDEQKNEAITVEAETEQTVVNASELTATETQIKKKSHFKKKDNTNN